MASILAVDDSPSIRKLVSCTLASAGYDVVEAGDGVEALGIAQANTVDLVVADVYMPTMDGISLIKELRALPAYKFTPILMLTSAFIDETKQQGKEAGVTGWIVKPFKPEELLSTIKKLMG